MHRGLLHGGEADENILAAEDGPMQRLTCGALMDCCVRVPGVVAAVRSNCGSSGILCWGHQCEHPDFFCFQSKSCWA